MLPEEVLGRGFDGLDRLARQVGLVAPKGVEGERRNVPKQDPGAAQEVLRSHQSPAPEQPEIGVLNGGGGPNRVIEGEECRDAWSHDGSGFYERCRWVSTRGQFTVESGDTI